MTNFFFSLLMALAGRPLEFFSPSGRIAAPPLNYSLGGQLSFSVIEAPIGGVVTFFFRAATLSVACRTHVLVLFSRRPLDSPLSTTPPGR